MFFSLNVFRFLFQVVRHFGKLFFLRRKESQKFILTLQYPGLKKTPFCPANEHQCCMLFVTTGSNCSEVQTFLSLEIDMLWFERFYADGLELAAVGVFSACVCLQCVISTELSVSGFHWRIPWGFHLIH